MVESLGVVHWYLTAVWADLKGSSTRKGFLSLWAVLLAKQNGARGYLKKERDPSGVGAQWEHPKWEAGTATEGRWPG